MNILIRKGKEFIISKREHTGKFFKIDLSLISILHIMYVYISDG